MTKRRGHGEGSIYWDESKKRWVASAPGGRDPVTGKRQRPKALGKTQKEAQARVRKMLSDLDAGVAVTDGNTTFGRFLDKWLDEVLPARARVKSSNTTDNYSWAINTWLKPSLGGKRLRTLTAEDIESVLSAMAKKGRSRNSVMRVRSVAVMALKHAERRRMVPRNVAELAEMPADAAKEREGRTLTIEQAESVIAAAVADDTVGPLVMVGLTLGLRPAEVAALRWDCLGTDEDSGAQTLRVGAQRTTRRGEDGKSRVVVGDAKTRKSQRTIALPGPTADAIQRQRAIQAKQRLGAGPVWQDNGLMFSTSAGTLLDRWTLRRMVLRFVDELDLGEGWTPYELFRHSAASILSALGVPLEKIADLLATRTRGCWRTCTATRSSRPSTRPSSRWASSRREARDLRWQDSLHVARGLTNDDAGPHPPRTNGGGWYVHVRAAGEARSSVLVHEHGGYEAGRVLTPDALLGEMLRDAYALIERADLAPIVVPP